MSAPIIRHDSEPHPDDDEGHPIPSLRVLDVVTILKGGGAELFIIVATPLAADLRSLTRLQDKIEAYLHHIQAVEFQTEAGPPNPSNTIIKVMLHPDSSPEAYELLYQSRDWVLANHATLKVEELDLGAH
jgi:hypothetical protein